jgi:hypothetical protein
MFRFLCALWVGLLVWSVSSLPLATAEPPEESPGAAKLQWLDDYAQAMRSARRQGKMLLVYFRPSEENDLSEKFESEVLSDPAVAEKLIRAVPVKVSVDAAIRVQGEEVVLMDHFAFKGLNGRPGVAIIDFVHRDPQRYGVVVSIFPLTGDHAAVIRRLAVIPDASKESPDDVAQKTSEEAQEPSASDAESPRLQWHTDYAEATAVAKQRRKMLFICFHDRGASEQCDRFASESLGDREVMERLSQVVKLKLPLDATIEQDGKKEVLLKQPAFAEMLGRPGVAMVDFAHPDAEYYGQVVSTFPFLRGRPYTAKQTAVILGLPPGTLTQRTLIYAVRTHPDRPASTEGQLDPNLLHEASLHSQHQARIRLQGHHNWNRRFYRINAKLPRGLSASEVCAESWPGENLVEAAIECVRCWRLSSGHWSAVRARHRVYGYDMKRGSNGIWYATGIFGRQR